MSRRLREIAEPFVVGAPSGARVRTRLRVDATDEAVLREVGSHLGSLAGVDLAARCREGRLDAKGRAQSRREHKRALTPESSSRWAGAITRTSEDAWQLARRNLAAEAGSLRARCRKIEQRLKVPAGGRQGRTRGYADGAERHLKERRLQVLRARLRVVEAMLVEGRVHVVRGGRPLLRMRNNLDAAGITATQWRERWEAERLFICADGEADKRLGNETIRFDPVDNSLEVRLPSPLAHLANRPSGRYRLSAPICFAHRGDEVAAQASTGAVRYDVSFDPGRGRWYLDASWKTRGDGEQPALDELRRSPVLAVDVNGDHLAAFVVTPDGNPVGHPVTAPLELAGLPASTRDGRLRAGLSELIHTAKAHGCRAFVIEDLGFATARAEGREHTGCRPSRGRRGRAFRRLVAGIPTTKFRDRLVQMSDNAGLVVVAVDPAYTSLWGAEHWLGVMREISPEASGHHAAALTIGRRGLGQRARRRVRCDSNPPEDGRERATGSAGGPTPAPVGLSEPVTREPGDRKARGRPHRGDKTRQARRAPPGDQATQDRLGPPAERGSLLLSG